MADSYSVKAVLSAVDRGFSSTLKSCSSALDSIDRKVSGFSFGILAGAGQAAFNAISGGISDMVGEINNSSVAWKTFEGNMGILGKTDGEIQKVKGTLQDFATKTIYSASDMASTYSQLASVGIDSADELVKGFGGLAAAAENPQQAMKTLSQQAVQMAAKPTVAWQDFKLMLEQSPAGMSAVAKQMGMTTSELVSNIQDGTVSTTDFFNAIKQVAGTGSEFEKMATQYKSVGQAMDGLKETASVKLMPAFEVFSQRAIGAISKVADSLDSLDAGAIADKVSDMMTKASRYWNEFKDAFSGVGTELAEAGSAIKKSIEEITGSFGSAKSLVSFRSIMDSVASGIKAVANFAEKHSDAIAKLITMLPKLLLALKGFSIAKKVAGFIAPFASGFTKIASAVGGGLVNKLFGVSGGIKGNGEAARASSNGMLAVAKSFMMLGIGVLAVAAGFGILAAASIALANAGGLAIGVMVGMVAAVVGLGFGMAMLLKFLAPMSKKLMPAAMAMLALGGAVVLVAAGFAIMAAASIALANAGGLAIGVMAGLVLALAGLMVLAAVLAPALKAGAAGFIAFGSAILMVGAGALLAAAALYVVSSVLPTIVQYGLQGAIAIAALGASMAVFAVGAALAGAACIILGAGLAVVGAGLLLVGAAVLITAAGVLALAAGALILGAGLMVCGAAVTMIAAVMPVAAAGTLLLVASFAALMAMALVVGASLLVMTAALTVVGVVALVASAGILAFGLGMTASAVGVLAMAAALKAVNSSMKSISKNAKSAKKSLDSMKNSVEVVESGLDAIGNKAKTAMNSLTSAFDNAASKAQSAGKKVGTGFTNGMQTGLSRAPSVAMMMVAAVCASLSTGYGSAYSSGAYISIGFANGMLSQLGTIRSAAAQMAAAADAAVRAKAKIGSPSRVAAKLGAWWGEGLGNGMLDMFAYVKAAAQKLVDIPTINTPNMRLAYAGAISGDYDYTRSTEYTLEIPVEIDGKEVAKATATFTQEELDKLSKRDRRKHGFA